MLYREISVSMDESGVPAPEALCDGVMNKILGEEITAPPVAAPAGENVNRHKPFRVILLRYAPLAACLAVVLLAVPLIISSLNNTRSDQTAMAPALRATKFKDMELSGESMTTDNSMPEPGGGDMFTAGGSSAPAPPASSEITPFGSQSDYTYVTADDDAIEYPGLAMEAPTDMPESAPMSPPGSAPMPEAVSDTVLSALSEAESEAQLVRNPDDKASMSQDADGSRGFPAPDQASGDIWGFLNNFSDAYAWIELTGELPKLLEVYPPEPLDGWLNWEAYYMVPRAAAQQLISEISNRDGVSITYNYNDGGYAIVLYSK